MLKCIRPFLDIPTTKLVYNTTILPLFDYYDVVWDSCNVTSSTKLERLQNRSARVITRTDNATPSDNVLHKLNWGKL